MEKEQTPVFHATINGNNDGVGDENYEGKDNENKDGNYDGKNDRNYDKNYVGNFKGSFDGNDYGRDYENDDGNGDQAGHRGSPIILLRKILQNKEHRNQKPPLTATKKFHQLIVKSPLRLRDEIKKSDDIRITKEGEIMTFYLD